ncbi:MAG: hypothetical protein ACI9EW_000516 [Cellvibrionaceae bacterium]|jgi:hypothetical protein
MPIMPLRHKYRITLTIILLTAALMRIVGFVTQSPPGPEHDEVANWLIAKAILGGQHGVYFTEAYGHEAGFHYWQTLFVGLVGDNLLALRAPAALMGILSVAVTYALNKRLFGRDFALLVTAIVAVLFMPVFFSRLALRAISLPVMAGLSAYFFWDWLSNPVSKEARRYLLTAALFAGLSSYTYMAARALPIFFVGFFVYLAIFHRPLFKSSWRDLLLFTAVYLIISLPLILFLQNLPTGESRIAEIDAPLRAMLIGDFRPVLQNGVTLFSSFGLRGDPLWRQGVAFQPIFEPLLALLFYVGLLISLWRIGDIRYGFILAWLGASVIPSLVTADAPSTIRMILMLPVMATFPIVVIEQAFTFFSFSQPGAESMENKGVIHSYPQLSTGNNQLSTRKLNFPLILVLTAVILMCYGARSGQAIFGTWANNAEVRFVWQEAFTRIGRHIDQSPEIEHVSIAGWSPETLDDPTMELVVKRDDINRRHFGTVGEIQTLIFPQSPHAIYRPNDLPLHPSLAEFLKDGHSIVVTDQFTVATSDTAALSEQSGILDIIGADQLFSNNRSKNELTFIGYKFVDSFDFAQIQLISFWEVGNFPTPADPNTKLFLHLVDNNGNLLAQHDGLDAPHRFWQKGDKIVQVHLLERSEEGAELRIGVYVGAPPWARFTNSTGSDFVSIPLNPSE